MKHVHTWSTGTVVSADDPWVEVRLDPIPGVPAAAGGSAGRMPATLRVIEHQVRPLPEGFPARRLEVDPFGSRG